MSGCTALKIVEKWGDEEMKKWENGKSYQKWKIMSKMKNEKWKMRKNHKSKSRTKTGKTKENKSKMKYLLRLVAFLQRELPLVCDVH